MIYIHREEEKGERRHFSCFRPEEGSWRQVFNLEGEKRGGGGNLPPARDGREGPALGGVGGGCIHSSQKGDSFP